MAAFLTAHTALLELHIDSCFVSLAEQTSVFQNPAALPHLTSFHLHARSGEPSALPPLLSALATAVSGSDKPRPVERLYVSTSSTQSMFAAAALLPNLTQLEVYSVQAGWLEEWTRVQELPRIPTAVSVRRVCGGRQER